MSWNVKVIRKDEQKTSQWSGGSTTELAIYPPTSEYKERNFTWRLSSARVADECSTFTQLPGFMRHILILEGTLDLHYENERDVTLDAFEQDYFDGAWLTKSVGKVRDFNLMVADQCEGELLVHVLDKGQRVHLDLDYERVIHQVSHARHNTGVSNPKQVMRAFYCVDGEAVVEISGDVFMLDTLHPSDLLFISGNQGDKPISLGMKNPSGKAVHMIEVAIVVGE